jgi:hypothetical protein
MRIQMAARIIGPSPRSGRHAKAAYIMSIEGRFLAAGLVAAAVVGFIPEFVKP